uniref:START domain-containing protein n=1 Tax=Oryza brachyantha TaxID=4533 RepID=J3M5W0_ORYBR
MQPHHRLCVVATVHSAAATIPFIASSCDDATTIHSVVAKIHSPTANIHSTSRGRISKQTWRRGAGGREGQVAGSRKSPAGKLPSPVIRSGFNYHVQMRSVAPAQRTIQQSLTVDLTKGSSASLFPFEKFDVYMLVCRVTQSMLRKYESGVKMIQINKMVAEILKDHPSWYHDCEFIDIIHVIPTGNGGTIEVIYMQIYAPTTLAAPLDFWMLLHQWT